MRELIFDERTGRTFLKARDQQLYTLDEVEAAESAARAGDEAALALLESLDRGGDGFDPMALLHDCPECRAALARGALPRVFTGEEVLARTRADRAPPPRLDRRARRAATLRAKRQRRRQRG
jgi:hypothetical protein